MFACLELSFKIIYKTASCCMFLFLLKNLYPYPRIGVFLEIAYPRIRYVSYPIHVPVSVHPRLQAVERLVEPADHLRTTGIHKSILHVQLVHRPGARES